MGKKEVDKDGPARGGDEERHHRTESGGRDAGEIHGVAKSPACDQGEEAGGRRGDECGLDESRSREEYRRPDTWWLLPIESPREKDQPPERQGDADGVDPEQPAPVLDVRQREVVQAERHSQNDVPRLSP